MKTIALVAQKGGTGKTTLTTALAVQAELAGLVTVILDLDPQGTASLWGDARGQSPEVLPVQAARLSRLLTQVRERGADIVFIDTAPVSDDAAAEAARLADLVLIPCRPSTFDLEAIQRTFRTCKAVAKRPPWVVINAVPARSRIGEEAAATLEKSKARVAPVQLGQLIGHVNPLAAGRSAGEWQPVGKAGAEMKALWTWLHDRLRER